MNNLLKSFLFAFISCLFIFSSCSKEDDCLDATVRFTNNSSNPYYLFIDDVFQKTMDGNTFTEMDLLEGQHSAKAEQVSGFVLFPTIRETTLSVFGCQEVEWVFP